MQDSKKKCIYLFWTEEAVLTLSCFKTRVVSPIPKKKRNNVEHTMMIGVECDFATVLGKNPSGLNMAMRQVNIPTIIMQAYRTLGDIF